MLTPRISETEVRSILSANDVDPALAAVLAVRGYYLDSIGRSGVNDRGLWDDAMIIVSPRGVWTFQGNTDPSRYRRGSGTGSAKGMATLKPGVWKYGKGRHKGRLAFRQCGPVTVVRDGNPDYEDTGFFALDIHGGGYSSTSSLGCQTLPASTWEQFRRLLYSALDESENPWGLNDWDEKARVFEYVLIEETARRAGNITVI